MKYILFLEDDHSRCAIAYKRMPEKDRGYVIWCRDALEAIDVLENYDVKEVYLDHDLEGKQFVDSSYENTGMEVVRWLEKQKNVDKFKFTFFTVHTWNIYAGIKMRDRLRKLGLRVIFSPFGSNQIIEESLPN